MKGNLPSKRLRVGIILDKLFPGKIGGAEQYVRNVLAHLKNLTNIVLFVNKVAAKTFTEDNKWSIVIVPDNSEIRNVLYNYYLIELKIDVVLCPLFYVPIDICMVPLVVSILDIQFEYFPENFSEELLRYRKEETRHSLEIADAIITISFFSKDTLIDKYGINPNKIFVTYLDSDSSFLNKLDINKKKEIIKEIGGEYIYYPANAWPHKNHNNLLKAFSIVKKQFLPGIKLVLSGNLELNDGAINQTILENGLLDEVIRLGYQKQENIPYIYAGANMLIFPSLYEGFGIPLVEAMRIGTPIVCSTCGSIPEIVKECALFFDASNPQDIAEKIYQLYYDNELREKLIEKGRLHSQDFSWEICAYNTLDILKKMVSSNKKNKKTIKQKVKIPHIIIFIISNENMKDEEKTRQSIINQEYPYFTVKIIEKADIYREVQCCVAGIIAVIDAGNEYIDGAFHKIVSELVIKSKYDMICGRVIGAAYKDNFQELFTKNIIINEEVKNNYISMQSVFATSRIMKKVMIKSPYYCFFFQFYLYVSIKNAGGNIKIVEDAFCVYNQKQSMMDRDTVIKYLNEKVVIPLYLIKTFCLQYEEGQSIMQEILAKNDFSATVREEGVEFEKCCPDGWISRNYKEKFSIDEDTDSIFVAGENVGIFDKPFYTNIFIDNQMVFSREIEKGKFELNISLFEKCITGEHIIEIQNSDVFLSQSEDIRALSLRIFSIFINGKNIITK